MTRWVMQGLLPNQSGKLTREGWVYLAVWCGLVAVGLQQQSNLVLLIAGIAFGPVVASFLVSGGMLRRIDLHRRAPDYVFEGDPLVLQYTLENHRRWTAALSLTVEDEILPADRTAPGAVRIAPRVVFARVPGRARERLRWSGTGPSRGRYRFASLDVVTRSPFGLRERRVTLPAEGDLVVYPRVGQLTRRWHQQFRESTETKRGRRYDRTVQQQEYHGLRDYRPGDSPRWIHWRTTARLGQPMVKEFEQQNEQDLAILVDPWLPRNRASADQREAVEASVRFTATVALEVCRAQGRRLTVGWTGAVPGMRQGPASVKLLHEVLEQLAILRPTSEGQLHQLFDLLPAAATRQAFLLVVTTRPIKLDEEMERSARLSSTLGRGFAGRIQVIDAAKGGLDDLIVFHQRRSVFAPPGASAEPAPANGSTDAMLEGSVS